MLLCDWRRKLPFPTALERLISTSDLNCHLVDKRTVNLWKTKFLKHKIKSLDDKRDAAQVIVTMKTLLLVLSGNTQDYPFL